MELIFVLIIAGILVAVAFPRFDRYLHQRQLVDARKAFGAMASRARASAVQRGDLVVLRISPDDERITVESLDGSETLTTLDLAAGDVRANVTAEQMLEICYVPGGFVDPGCGDASLLPAQVGFADSRTTLLATLTAAGQVDW